MRAARSSSFPDRAKTSHRTARSPHTSCGLLGVAAFSLHDAHLVEPANIILSLPEGNAGDDHQPDPDRILHDGLPSLSFTVPGRVSLFRAEGSLVPVKVAVQRAEAIGGGAIVEVVVRLNAARWE